MYSNFRRYTAKNERLSIFGDVKDNKLEIFIIQCNPKDKFEKQISWFAYEKWKNEQVIEPWFSPMVFLIPIVGDNTPRWTFDRFCDTYYKKSTKVVNRTYEVTVLNNGEKEIEVKGCDRRLYKMDN